VVDAEYERVLKGKSTGAAAAGSAARYCVKSQVKSPSVARTATITNSIVKPLRFPMGSCVSNMQRTLGR
jgi:hypothetical protein